MAPDRYFLVANYSQKCPDIMDSQMRELDVVFGTYYRQELAAYRGNGRIFNLDRSDRTIFEHLA